MKSGTYVFQPRNVKEKDFDLVGNDGYGLSTLKQKGINILPSFIITTIAFDHFISSSDLVTKISNSLKKAKPFIKETAKEASEEIAHHIISAKIPKLITDPIEIAYENLVEASNNPTVRLIPSSIVPSNLIPPSQVSTEVLIKGLNDLIYQIKLNWLTLFSTEAIELRTNNYYKGPLSLGIIVQKSPTPELSGTSRSIADEKGSRLIEITSLYGIPGKGINPEMLDRYTVNDDNGIADKAIGKQEFMYIKKGGNINKEDNTLKVEISETWKKNQKISDDKIIKIAKYHKEGESLAHAMVETNWIIESGDVYVLTLQKTNVVDAIASKSLKEEEPIEKAIVEDLIPLEIKKEDKLIRPMSFDKVVDAKASMAEPSKSLEEVDNIEAQIIEEEIEEMAKPEENIIVPIIDTQTEVKEDRKVDFYSDFELATPLMLDLSNLNSKYIASSKYFSGAFFDGTQMLLRNSSLPEEVKDYAGNLSELIDKYSLEVSTAAKAEIANPLIYQFSSISKFELAKLGLDPKKYPRDFDERFLAFPESLAVELVSIKKARNQFMARNINISFSGVRNLKNLESLIKVANSQGVIRSSLFKYYAEVSMPSFIFDFDNLSNTLIDGLILNYDKFIKISNFRNDLREIDHRMGLQVIKLVKEICEEKKLEFHIRINNYTEELMSNIIELRPAGLILGFLPPKELVRKIRDYEQSFLKKTNKGRKPKDLF